MTHTEELTVLLDVPARHAGQNPYISLLADSLRARGARVEFFTWRRALLGRYSVLHAHWPEYLVWHRRFLVRTAYQIGATALALRLWLQQRPVVRTVHNRTPHDALPSRMRTMLRLIESRARFWIYLTAEGAPGTVPSATSSVIPHGHYKDWPPYRPDATNKAGYVLAFGHLKPYKGYEALIRAFRATDLPALKILGRAGDGSYLSTLRDAAGADPRVEIDSRYLPDRELAQAISGAHMVVLPYKDFYNSGAALLALSLGTPLVVPKNEITEALRCEVGADWVMTYEGALTEDVLGKADGWAAGQERPPGPRLAGRDWDPIAREHISAYRTALQSSRGPRKDRR